MKIVFICGSLEAGKDGVGDYTSRLTSELVRKGNSVGIISLSDKYIIDVFDGKYKVDDLQIPVLRLPDKYALKRRFSYVKDWIDTFGPSWISLQFVPFSFDNKGLIFGLAKNLIKIGSGRYWHIMFHETWVGMENGASAKMKIWGWLQRHLVKDLLQVLKPVIINTNTPLYKYQLQKIGAKVELLPIFGNFPVRDRENKHRKTNNNLTFVLFGGIHYGAPIGDFIAELSAWNTTRNYQLTFVFAGNNGPELENWTTRLLADGFMVKVFGFLPVNEVVTLFLDADVGITTTPQLLVGKSGSVAAMKECGLPVTCVARYWTVDGFKDDGLLVLNLEQCLTLAIEQEGVARLNALSDCANSFMEEISFYG